MQKAIIFDMDGVIFDSERAVLKEWQILSKKYGFEGFEEIYPYCIGATAKKSKEIFCSRFGEDFPYEEYSKEKSVAFHKKYDGGKLPIKNGIVEILTFLKEEGYFIALASSTRREAIMSELTDAGLIKFFDRIISGDMVERSKPSPDIFLKAIEGLDVSPKDVFVIEDSFNGIRAAHAANMRPVMVPDMLMPDEEIKGLSEVVLKDLFEVKKYIGNKTTNVEI